MRQRYEPKGVSFLALALEPDEAQVRAAAADLGIRMKVAVARGEVLGPLGVREVPSTVFVSRDGIVVAAASGERSERFFDARARDLLAAVR